MDITVSQIISWIIVGFLAGSLIGMILKGGKRGFGLWGNLVIGLVGAIIGGVIFSFLKIDFGLSNIAISAADVVHALIGAFIFVIILSLIKRRK